MENLKKEKPDLAPVIDKRLPNLYKRLEVTKNPSEVKEASLAKVRDVLDLLETKLKTTGVNFLCGKLQSSVANFAI